MKIYIVVALFALAGFAYADDGAANSPSKDSSVAAKDDGKPGKKDDADSVKPSTKLSKGVTRKSTTPRKAGGS